MKILITGGAGYIAKAVSSAFVDYDVTVITREDFDLTDKESTDLWFKDKMFDVIIHTATVGGSRLKADTSEELYQNLQMFYNLFDNKKSFNKFIQFGSGAEYTASSSPYGLSKRVINDISKQYPNFYNLRIFGVFNSNELETRFIKNNIINYINNNPIEIYKDKFMDFIYMDDLVTIVKMCIDGDMGGGEYNCVYSSKYKLSDIAILINNLDIHTVDINIYDNELDTSYISDSIDIKCKGLKGIEKGIQETYISLKS
jgi:nucleoside-diphosphate-sugar epimerase